MVATATPVWDRYWDGVTRLRAEIARSTAVNINAKALREVAEGVVQVYFRELRPELAALLGDEPLAVLDARNQAILRLAQGNNAKVSYTKEINAAMKQRNALAGLRELRIGQAYAPPVSDTPDRLTPSETRIMQTIEGLLPATAHSYHQAILDLKAEGRVSYRGTAVELRETLREVLDHLAPDGPVMEQPGFTLEKDRQAPTMRQKAQFVLKSRGISADDRKPTSDAITVIDELTAGLVRSAYEKGSKATHGSTSLEEAERIKMWVDAVLAELLHAGVPESRRV